MTSRADIVRLIQGLSAGERLWQPDPREWLKEQDQMARDEMKADGRDRARINVDESYEVMDWCKSLGVTEDELRTAVAKVGDEADQVRKWLRK